MIMKKIKYTGIIILGLLALIGIFSFAILNNNKEIASSEYIIENIWELPEELNEVSGIVWLEENKLATVQDEDGIIFIYDLKNKQIIDRIEFAGPGDYEGIALNNDDAYVMRSDGTIYEVSNFQKENKKISVFKTGFSEKNNIETICVDTESNSLIVMPKDRDREDDFKGLYEISLDSKKMNEVPRFKINMNDAALKSFRDKKSHKTFSPSDVAIHPKTGEYYVLEGKKPKLAILDKTGKLSEVYELDKRQFEQPEGITFSPDGTLYIANEAGNGKANIKEVRFK